MAYEPQYLLPAQITQESGGRQLDANGNPIRSNKGALGIAQVMPGTAPEAARIAGVAWDPVKYANDRDYNLQIGDAYQGHLNQRFADDPVAARAAYNAGPTRVAELKSQYGSSWASYLPTETKKYVHNVLGVNVDGPNGYYNPQSAPSDNIKSIADNLGISLGDYKVGQPTAGEKAQVGLGADINTGVQIPDVGPAVGKAAAAASTTSDRYTTFLNGAVQPLVQNMAAQTEGYQRIAAVKTGLANDFKMRETDMESKIQPLMAKREQIATQIANLDNMSPIERRMKAIFNPMQYDPRMLRGQLERVEGQMQALDSNYSELNKLRSGVAAASVDAQNADIGVLEAGRQSSLAEGQLLGQVAGATREQVSAAMLPLTAASETMSLQEHQHAATLGKLSLEETHSLLGEAQNSPDGTITVQGIKFTVGELQKADQANQSQDLSLRSMVNANRTGDLMTAQKVEDEAITHMTYEQLSQALQNNGMYRGVKLDMTKLVAAQAAAMQGRSQQVQDVMTGTAMGQAHELLVGQGGLRDQLGYTRGRLSEMFGQMPGDWSQYEQGVTSSITSWNQGLVAAKAKGVGNEYVTQTMPQLQAIAKQKDQVIDGLAKKWSGGNTSLYDVASAYMRGDPLNGDAAIKGLIGIARSGMPAGAKLSGPAAQAVEAARSIVREFDNPQAGDSLQAMLQGTKSQADKDRELMNRVRSSVGAIYANGLTDSLIQSFPELSRQIRDPNNPNKAHPFAQVNPDDFKAAVAHGDNSGYEVVGSQMGVSATTAKIIFQKGVDSPEWQNVAKAKGYTPDKFGTFLGALQSIQMSETLSALDASHSSHPGFSAAKAYVDFLQDPNVQHRLDQAVGGYGRSNFGAFLVNGAAGGGYRDNWTAYTQAIANQYFLNNGRSLQQRIQQQRSMSGDPYTRFNAVNMAAGLNKQESQLLMQNVRPLVNLNNTPDSVYLANRIPDGSMGRDANNFDMIASIVRNHQFDDPQIERIRKKVANQWDVSDDLVGKVFDSVSQ